MSSPLNERTSTHSFLGDLSDQHGEWTLRVTELVSHDLSSVEEPGETREVTQGEKIVDNDRRGNRRPNEAEAGAADRALGLFL